MRFFNFFVAYIVQEYQNESPPIFYYGKSPKTNRKHLKIPYLQALALGRVIKMTLYFPCTTHETSLCEFHSRTLHRLVCFTSFVKYIVSSRLSFDPHTHSIVLLRIYLSCLNACFSQCRFTTSISKLLNTCGSSVLNPAMITVW